MSTPPVPPMQPENGDSHAAQQGITPKKFPTWGWITIGAGALVLALIAIILVVSLSSNDDNTNRERPTQTSKPSEPAESTPTPTATPTPSVAPEASNEIPAQPTAAGASLTLGQWANIPFTTYAGNEEISFGAKLNRVEQASDSDVAQLVSRNPELAGNQVYYMFIDVTAIGQGPALVDESLDVGFHPIDAAGDETGELGLIGSDSCPNPTRTDREVIDQGGTYTLCVAGFAPANGNVPTGVNYAKVGTDFWDAPITWN